MWRSLPHGAKIGAAKLWFDKPKQRFYVLVSLETEVAEPTPETHQRVIGVDVGQRYLAVVARLDNGATFFPGKAVRAKADHYARLRKRLQRKGTRQATRRLLVIAGRERRLKQATNHQISRRIVSGHPHSLIGLEDLTHIRERTKRKRGKKATRKQRLANRHASAWAFAQLHDFLAYKALLSPPCRLDRCAKRCAANAAPAARLDEHGRLVGTPRGLVPGYVGP